MGRVVGSGFGRAIASVPKCLKAREARLKPAGAGGAAGVRRLSRRLMGSRLKPGRSAQCGAAVGSEQWVSDAMPCWSGVFESGSAAWEACAACSGVRRPAPKLRGRPLREA